jgi:hypothetical protein
MMREGQMSKQIKVHDKPRAKFCDECFDDKTHASADVSFLDLGGDRCHVALCKQHTVALAVELLSSVQPGLNIEDKQAKPNATISADIDSHRTNSDLWEPIESFSRFMSGGLYVVNWRYVMHNVPQTLINTEFCLRVDAKFGVDGIKTVSLLQSRNTSYGFENDSAYVSGQTTVELHGDQTINIEVCIRTRDETVFASIEHAEFNMSLESAYAPGEYD